MNSPGAIFLSVLGLCIVYQLFFRFEHFTGGPDNKTLYERDSLTGEIREVEPGSRRGGGFSSRLFGSRNDRYREERYSDASGFDEFDQGGRHRSVLRDSTQSDGFSMLDNSRNRRASDEGLLVGEKMTQEDIARLRAKARENKAKEGTRLAHNTRNDEPLAMMSMASPVPTQSAKTRDAIMERLGLRGPAEVPSLRSRATPEALPPIPVPKASRQSKASSAAAQRIQPGLAAQAGDLNGDGAPEKIFQNQTADDGLLDISVIANSKEVFYGRGTGLTILSSSHGGWYDLQMSTGGKRHTFRYDLANQAYQRVE